MKEIAVIFEDEYLVAIDKPSGITVNRSENEKGETVQDFAEKKIFNIQQPISNKIGSDFINRAGIVHRLDKETSGLLLIAKDEDSFLNLQKQFQERVTKKCYLAFVHGKIDSSSFEINQPVGRLPWNRRKFGVISGGREAVTKVKVMDYYRDRENNLYTFIEVTPLTGRTHQIRIHLKHMQHPILSDRLYAGRKQYRNDIKYCPRLFLHAQKLEFIHPKNRKTVKLESKLASDLILVLSRFDKIQ